MCCLFGMLDYKRNLTRKQQNKLLSILSAACEERGRDATGIAYNYADRLCIYKRPLPARFMGFRLPEAVTAVMGHTRMTTQGSERKNYNNHPFCGSADNARFALAHNGVLYNDCDLQKTEKLPDTKIETDSYVAVQLIEKRGTLDFDSLRYIAEQLMGSFTITVLDGQDNLYFVKGDNPMCIYHYEQAGIYLYASTEEILQAALKRIPYHLGKAAKVELSCGEILRIDRQGKQTRAHFNTENLLICDYYRRPFYPYAHTFADNAEYVSELKSVASGFGYTGDTIDYLLEEGYTTDDIEEFLYCGW